MKTFEKISSKTKKHIRTGIKSFAAAAAALSIFTFSSVSVISQKIPTNVNVIEGRSLSFNSFLPIRFSSQSVKYIQAAKASSPSQHYTDEVKLFGMVPIKDINVNVVDETYVIPGGETFGIKLYTDGVVVVGMGDVDTKSGNKNPARDAGVKTGDIIMAINGKPVCTNDEVGKIFSQSGGKTVDLSMRRNGVAYSTSFAAVKSESSGEYKAGLWVRDSTAGIGTITFYDGKSHVFGGLGHGICDIDTGEIMPLMSGDVVKADISGVQKGIKGQPGELQGTLQNVNWGNLSFNTETGVFGVLNSFELKNTLPVAMCQDIKEGDAQIISSIDSNGPKMYSVKIEKIHFNDDSPTKNMIIRVTDQELLNKTGGIVQGMSGSPIIQNGHIVGALTHVFINEPELGYGIFAENMIKTSKALENSNQIDVS